MPRLQSSETAETERTRRTGVTVDEELAIGELDNLRGQREEAGVSKLGQAWQFVLKDPNGRWLALLADLAGTRLHHGKLIRK